MWNGSSWTEVNDLTDTGRYSIVGIGTSTAALAVGGYGPPGSGTRDVVESWNGTSWTGVTHLNVAKFGSGAAGTQPSALVFGGENPGGLTGQTEQWNGSSWTEVNDLNTARFQLGGAGTTTAGLAFGGSDPSITAATEEWSNQSFTTRTVSTD